MGILHSLKTGFSTHLGRVQRASSRRTAAKQPVRSKQAVRMRSAIEGNRQIISRWFHGRPRFRDSVVGASSKSKRRWEGGCEFTEEGAAWRQSVGIACTVLRAPSGSGLASFACYRHAGSATRLIHARENGGPMAAVADGPV